MNLMSPLAKITHRISDQIPGLRVRIWWAYRCTQESFVDASDPSIVPRRISREELGQLAVVNPRLTDPWCLAGRFDRGNECWVVDAQGRPVFYEWAMLNPSAAPLDLGQTSRAPRGYVLPPRSVYLWDGWCAEHARNRGTLRRATAAVFLHYVRDGATQALAAIAPFNTPSIRGCTAIGFTYQRTLFEFSLGRRPPG